MRRNIAIAIAVLMVLLSASCRNYVYVPVPTGGNGGSSVGPSEYSVGNYAELVDAVTAASDGDRIEFRDGFSVPTSTEAVEVSKSLTMSGSILIGDGGSTASLMAAAPKAGGTFTLFRVTGGKLSLSGLTVTVGSGAEAEVSSLISVSGSGAVDISADTVLPSGVTVIEVTADATDPECIMGTISGIVIDIAADSPIREELAGSLADAEITVGGKTGEERVAGFLNELDKEAISDYLIANKDTIMSLFEVSMGDGEGQIQSALYESLQGGETVEISLNDGGVMRIHGHFYEPADDFPYWDMYIEYDVPAGGTAECFPEGSGYRVESGNVVLHVSNAEITNENPYDIALLIYGYDVTLKEVEIAGPAGRFTLGIDKLTKPLDFSDYTIIDPNAATEEIHVREFVYPPKDAEGTIAIDGGTVLWSDIYPLLS